MPPDAPRFRAYWEHLEGRSVLTMARTEWTALSGEMGRPVEIDVSRTPMVRVESEASVVKALLEETSEATGEIAIIRYDANDQPTPYNQDKYTVWVDVLSHHSIADIVSGASTEINDNFREFAAENVFIIKQDPGPDHWLPSLPGSATTVVKST